MSQEYKEEFPTQTAVVATSAPSSDGKPKINVTASGEFLFEEDRIIAELARYIVGTYGEHYAGGDATKRRRKVQQLEQLIQNGSALGFCVGNMQKYPGRYGLKGGRNRKDLVKGIHYGILALYVHDLEEAEKASA